MAVHLHDINQRIADVLGIDTTQLGVTHITLHFDAVGIPTAEVTVLVGLDDSGERLAHELRRYQLTEIHETEQP